MIPEKEHKKEKFITLMAKFAADVNIPGMSVSSIGKVPEIGKSNSAKPMTEPIDLDNKLETPEIKTNSSASTNAFRSAANNPARGRTNPSPKPLRPQQVTHIPRPFSKIAYKRNTGIKDSDGLPYTNNEDVSLLAKLGYSVDKDYYLFLPRGEEKEDLYSYVEKVAGVSRDVARCIDQGTAFSSEHLKDMGYEVPEGYEVKGDLVCPIEKKAELVKQAIYDNIVIENPKGSKKEFGKNYPIPVMTYPVDYGYLPGYMAQDDADLDFFKGSDTSKGFHGSFDVWRPDVKGELETKFYTSANEEEKKAILEAFKKVIRGTPKEYDNAALLDAINSFKVKTAAADSVHTYELLGEVQGVGLRKELHSLLNEMNHPGLAVNYPETGKVMALIPGNKKSVKNIFSTLKERLSNREDERLVYGKDYKIKSVPNNNEKFKKFEFTDKHLNNFMVSNPELERLKAADKASQFKYFQDRYRLTQNSKGNLVGKLPQKAIDQLKGLSPVYNQQIKERTENKVKTAEDNYTLYRGTKEPLASSDSNYYDLLRKALKNQLSERKDQKLLQELARRQRGFFTTDKTIAENYAGTDGHLYSLDLKDSDLSKIYGDYNNLGKANQALVLNVPHELANKARLVDKTAEADPSQTILITGHSGSGKSTLGKLLAEKLNLPLHRVDAQQSWDDLRANLEAAPDYEIKALTPGTLENKKYIRDIRKIVRKSLGDIDGPAILEGTQVTTLPDKQLKKYMANILVGGDVNQSIAQRLERMRDKAAKKGISFSPEQIEKKKFESKLVAESWSPGMDKFNKLPGVLRYNHTEHKPEALIDQLRVLMNKTANALVVSGIHGDEPAGDKAAEKLKDSVDVVSDINPSDKRRFEGKDINRHFDKPTEGKVQKTILDIIRKKKPSKVIALHEDDEVDKPYAYSSESLKDDTREALKEYSTASSAHGDKTEDGVISEGKNPPDGSLEKALDDRDVPRVTLETPSKSQNMNKRVETQLDVVKKLLGKKADLTNTQPAMSLSAPSITGTHSPINIQTSTQGQSTPVDYTAKNKALASAGKSFAVDQFFGALPGMIGLGGRKIKDIAASVGPKMSARAAKGINTLESGAHVGVGELSAARADNPRTAKMDRGLSYLNSVLSYVPNPLVRGTTLAGNVLYDVANAADVYYKTMSPAPPSMGKVPEQKFNISLKQPTPAPVNFRVTQPNVRDQQTSPNVNISTKQGEATHELKSSNIKAVGYDKKNKRLEVAFHSGGNYTYNDVPKSLFDRIKRVKSPGKFFHKHIKRDNSYSYERMGKESEYKLHWSKDLHRDVTNNRHYPFSFLTGEAQELVDAVKNRDWNNFKEEIGDTTYAAQMLAAQATGLNHPVYADLSKHYGREKVWKDMFREKGSTYHPKHMEGGSNYAKASKIIKAFASAGIKVDQREAERLANKYTGGKMEKEAGSKIIPPHIRDLMIRRSQGDLTALEALRNIGRANAAKRARLKPINDLINRTSEPAVVQPKPVAPVVPVEEPVRLDPEVIRARFDEIRRSLGKPGQNQ